MGGSSSVSRYAALDGSPGHNVKVGADAEIVMFSPQREHGHVIDHMIEKVNTATVSR
jgi:hypothetical protein